jgi:parallel beta-helix repeat protein
LDYSGGIELEYSQYNTVSKNNITQNSLSCVKLRYSDHNFIIYNDLTHSAHGVSFLEASENTVYSNNIAYHSNVGVSLWGGQGNLIYLNNFIGCHAGGRDARYIWDNGTVGNYWSNYNGTDQDNDGIGDEPYSFNAFSTMGLGDIINTDSYPLMKPPVDIEAMLDFADEEPYILPTMTPDQEPQETELVEIIMVLAVIAIVLGAGVGLLVYLVRRK